MKRRDVLALGAALALAPGTVASAQGATFEWEPFKALMKAFDDMLKSGDLIADGVDRDRFRALVEATDKPLGKIERAKRRVHAMLSRADCAANSDPFLAPAQKAADDLLRDVQALSGDIDRLSNAIKPTPLRDSIKAVASRLSMLEAKKVWAPRVDQFCRTDAAGRAAFLAEIDASIDVVAKARDSLDAVVAKLGG